MHEQNMDLEVVEAKHAWTKHGFRSSGSSSSIVSSFFKISGSSRGTCSSVVG